MSTTFGLRKSILLIVILGFVILSTGCIHKELALNAYNLIDFDDSELQTWDVPYDGKPIHINSNIGRINIEGQDAPNFVAVSQFVSIEVIRRVQNVAFEEIEIEVEVDEDGIYINASGPESVGTNLRWAPPFVERRMGLTEFTIRVPKDIDISITQEVGEIVLTNLGEISDDGDLSGQIEITQRVGDIALENSQLEKIEIEQTYGDIAVLNTIFDEAEIRTRKVGDIYVSLPLQYPILIEARTTLKEISVDGIDLESDEVVADMDQTWPGQELQFFYLTGDARLSLETLVGNIVIDFEEAWDTDSDPNSGGDSE